MPNSLKPSVILLAEDCESDVRLMRRAFEKAKIVNPLQVVGDGEQVVAYLKGEGLYADRERHPLPSLLLLDLKMPRMNGFDVLTWVRAQPELKALRVVVLTASRELQDVNRAYQMGANTFLIKPTDFDQLMVMIQALQGWWIWMCEEPLIQRPSRNAEGI